jgi:hypothetical protein
MRHLLFLLAGSQAVHSFTVQPSRSVLRHSCVFLSSDDDWPSFSALEDDDEILIDNTKYAKEEDSQERKAEVGALREAPTIEFPAEPISVPPGTYYRAIVLSHQQQDAISTHIKRQNLYGILTENRSLHSSFSI